MLAVERPVDLAIPEHPLEVVVSLADQCDRQHEAQRRPIRPDKAHLTQEGENEMTDERVKELPAKHVVIQYQVVVKR